MLIDFGISTRLIREAERSTSPESLDGTLAYMSPEQTGRMNRSIDCRTDFYSLGVTLYEMLTGTLPFPSIDPIELVHCHMAKVPRPPHQVDARIPLGLSALVMKLLEKAPENRYQSATGLKADLTECQKRLAHDGQIAAFALGTQDRGEELRIPQMLYGRKNELAILGAALERTSRGAAELCIVSGYIGAGKTALVSELYKTLAPRGGYFVSGRFDQWNRSVPYSAVSEALRELTRQVLITRSQALKGWADRLQAAVGSNGSLLIEMIPELQLIIGEQPAVPGLGPLETQNRFNLVFQNFLHVFTTAEHPLVLFLDDLQYADQASLKLVQTLLSDPERRYLLVVGAYRDNEIGLGHPLLPWLSEVRDTGAVITEIKVPPLDAASTERLVADALGVAPAEAQPLSQIVQEKTHGNPFFVSQFLQALHAEKLLQFDTVRWSWTWDARAMEERIVTANVADLLIGKVERLSPSTQKLLQVASCLGIQWSLQALAAALEKPTSALGEELQEAVREGLLLARELDARQLAKEGRDAATAEEPEANVTYRFVHDRLHSSVYSRFADAEKRAVHLRIGRQLLAGRGAADREDALFDIVHHLNIGAPLITSSAERLELARLDLSAGRRAKAATAYPTACAQLAAAMALLDESADAQLVLALHIERAECEHLNNQTELADSLFEKAMALSSSRLERASIYNLRANLVLLGTQFAEALRFGLAGLAELDITFPKTPELQQAAMMTAMGDVATALGDRRVMDFADAPRLIDPEQIAAQQLLNTATASAYMVQPTIWPLLILKMLNISLVHGNSADSPYAYVSYGFMLVTGMARYEEGCEFGRLAIAVNERFKSAHMTCKVNMLFANSMFFQQPVRTTLTYVERAYQAGIASGDFAYLASACATQVLWKLSLGEELGAVKELIAKYLVLSQRIREPLTTTILTIMRQSVAAMQGTTREVGSFSDDAFSETDFVAGLERSGNHFGLLYHSIFKLQTLYLFEDYEAAQAMTLVAEGRVEQFRGLNVTTEVPFYGSLSLLASPAAKSSLTDGPNAALLARYREQLASWAQACPPNFARKHLIVQAEVARVESRDADAASLYAQAIAQSQKDGGLCEEALASYLCAKFYLSRGRTKLASAFLSEAHFLFLRWGVTAKATALLTRYAHLIEEPSEAPKDESTVVSSSSGTRAVSGGALDTALVMRAAHAIASEIMFDKVLDQLMRIVASHAGAQRGFLILDRNGREGHAGALMLMASIDVDSEFVEVDLNRPVESCGELAVSIVQFVARTCQPVVLADASSEPRFATDPYIAARKPKSLICLPLQHRSRLTGVVYLENNSATGVFTAERSEILRLLSSQAATAVENALLYGHVQAMTHKLQESNSELRAANDRLQIELTERERAEQERAELKDEIIRVQNARLAEMSTPLIPITEQIMVMPLIGTMDTQRANQVMETALNGAQNSRAQVVIIDITGMKHVDTNVASALIKAARALRLLGAQALLTGIRADIAQTLVSLGVDMSSIVTSGTLQSGIAHALRISGSTMLGGRTGAGLSGSGKR